MRRDPRLADAVSGCDLVLADGQAVVWAAKVLRAPLPERVAGIDLFLRLLAEAESTGISVYFLGAKEEVLEEMLRRVADRFPGLKVAGSRNGYFDDSQQEAIAGDIARSGAQMLFLGMTSPKKEIFTAAHGARTGARVVHGVGVPSTSWPGSPRAPRPGSGSGSSGSTAHSRSRAGWAGATSPPTPPSFS